MEEITSILEKNCKLPKDVFAPSYGLAEVGSAVAMSGKQLKYLNKRALYDRGEIQYIDDAKENKLGGRTTTIPVYGCGEIDNNLQLGENKLGEIWIYAASVARRYVESDKTQQLNCRLANKDDPETSRGYFATGDLGFIHNGDVFILGRKCDLIPYRGRQVFPHHVEAVVNKLGKTTAYINDDSGYLSLAVEVRGRKDRSELGTFVELTKMAQRIADSVCMEFGLLDEIVNVSVHFIPPKSAIRTTRGKLERVHTGDAIATGRIKPLFTWKAQNHHVSSCGSRLSSWSVKVLVNVRPQANKSG